MASYESFLCVFVTFLFGLLAGNPVIRKSGNPDIRKSGHPDIKSKSGVAAFVCNVQVQVPILCRYLEDWKMGSGEWGYRRMSFQNAP